MIRKILSKREVLLVLMAFVPPLLMFVGTPFFLDGQVTKVWGWVGLFFAIAVANKAAPILVSDLNINHRLKYGNGIPQFGVLAAFCACLCLSYSLIVIGLPAAYTVVAGEPAKKTFVISSRRKPLRFVAACDVYIGVKGPPPLFNMICQHSGSRQINASTGSQLVLRGRESVLGFVMTGYAR